MFTLAFDRKNCTSDRNNILMLFSEKYNSGLIGYFSHTNFSKLLIIKAYLSIKHHVCLSGCYTGGVRRWLARRRFLYQVTLWRWTGMILKIIWHFVAIVCSEIKPFSIIFFLFCLQSVWQMIKCNALIFKNLFFCPLKSSVLKATV